MVENFLSFEQKCWLTKTGIFCSSYFSSDDLLQHRRQLPLALCSEAGFPGFATLKSRLWATWGFGTSHFLAYAGRAQEVWALQLHSNVSLPYFCPHCHQTKELPISSVTVSVSVKKIKQKAAGYNFVKKVLCNLPSRIFPHKTEIPRFYQLLLLENYYVFLTVPQDYSPN